MIHSRHLQQCIGLTLGAIATGLAIRYRNQIFNFIWQNHRQNFDYDIWIICSGPQTSDWTSNTLLPQLANKNIALDILCDIPGKFRSDNILEIATRSEKVIIVLDPDVLKNRWLRYQIAVALQRPRSKILIYSLQTMRESSTGSNNKKHLCALDFPQLHQLLQVPSTVYHLEYDFWVVYSGLKSQEWVVNKLLPRAHELDKIIAIGIKCYLPGKARYKNIRETAQKSQKVIIVLGPERSPNELFRYEIEHALLKGPQDTQVCELSAVELSRTGLTPRFSCLKPLSKITINPAKPNEELVAIKQLLKD